MLKPLGARTSIRLLFGLVAFCLGIWTYNIAAFKLALELSRSQLSLILLAMPIAMSITFTQAPRLTRTLGARKMIRFGIGLVPVFVSALALSPWPALSFTFIFCMGICAGLFELGLSSVAQKIDRDDAPIVSSCHGFWSIGIGIGAFLGGVMSELGLSFPTQSLIVLVPAIYCVLWWSSALPVPRASSADDHGYAFPTLALLPLCLLPFAGLFIEGAIADWNTEFVKHERGWNDILTGSIGLTFMGGMAISRLSGDLMRIKFGAKPLFIASTILSLIGMALYAQGGIAIVVICGALLGGLGAGNVYPLTIVVANEGRTEEEFAHILSAIALISFNAFVLAPVIMGVIGQHFSMATAFTLTLPLLALTFVWLKLSKV